MAIYGTLVQENMENILFESFIKESYQFDAIMENYNIGIINEANINFNTIIEKIKGLWTKFKTWIKEKFGKLKQFIKDTVQNFIQVKKKEESKEKPNKDDVSEDKEDKLLKVSYYKYPKIAISVIKMDLHLVSAYEKYLLNIKIDRNNSDYSEQKEKCSKIEEEVNKELEKIKQKDYVIKKEEESIELKDGILVTFKHNLEYLMKDIRFDCEQMTDLIKQLNKDMDTVEQQINEYDKHVNELLNKIKKNQEELAKGKNKISDIKDRTNNRKKEFIEKELRIFKNARYYSNYKSEEEIYKAAEKIYGTGGGNDGSIKYYKSRTNDYNNYIRYDVMEMNIVKNDIMRFRDLLLFYTGCCADFVKALQANKVVYSKVLNIYNSEDPLKDKDKDITIEVSDIFNKNDQD